MRRSGSRPTAPRFIVIAVLVSASVCAVACEKTNHKNIDRWMKTEKGPGKLDKALRSGSNNAALRGHAAANLIRIGRFEDVNKAMKDIKNGDRGEVLADLVPRLWKLARLDNPMASPSPVQTRAKDALFHLRQYATGATRDKIDNYLLDWLTTGYYDGRARSGSVAGSAIIGTLGAKAGERMRTVLKKALGDPGKQHYEIRLPTLLGVALTGESESVGLLLRTASANLGRPKLEQRIFEALYGAYIHPQNKYYKPASPAALKPNLKRLKQEMLSGSRYVDTAIQLIAAAGPPECIGPLVAAIARADSRLVLRFVAAQNALKCGKLRAVIPVAEAFPTSGSYSKEDLVARLWADMVQLKPAQKVAEQARTLLNSDSWVARLTGMEVLTRLKLAKTAASDAALVGKLTKDKTRLRGWWGDQQDVPKGKRKPTPTLGKRARQVVQALEELAKGSKK